MPYTGEQSILIMREAWGLSFDKRYHITSDRKLVLFDKHNAPMFPKIGDMIVKGLLDFYPVPKAEFDVLYEMIHE